MTSTSEISGNASSGILRSAQIPANTRKSVPVKTRKRFRAHQSIQRAITLHSSCCADGYLFARNGLSVFSDKDRDLPRSAAFKLGGTFVNARSFLRELYLRAHRSHTHFRHTGHEKRHADFCARDRCAVCIGHFYAKNVATFARRAGL